MEGGSYVWISIYALNIFSIWTPQVTATITMLDDYDRCRD